MIEEQLKTTLSSLVGGRVYPMTAPDKPTTPYITYQNIAGSPENTFNGVPINNDRMQIDCFDKTYSGVKTLAANVVTAMQAASYANVQTMNQDIYEAEVKLYRVQFDFSIWY